MADHTPGPWTTRDTRDHGTEVQAEHFDGRTIATVYPRGNWYLNGEGTDPVQEANARLIAAAPDLLAAVQSAAWIMQRVAEWDGTGEPITKFAAKVHGDEFRAVLAKARGEASHVGR